MNYLNLSLAVLLLSAAKAESLQCYECVGDQCNDIKDDMLISCGFTSPTSTSANGSEPTTQAITATQLPGSTDIPTQSPTAPSSEPTVQTGAPNASIEQPQERLSRTLLSASYRLSTDPQYACYSVNIAGSKRKHGCIEYTGDACMAVKETNEIESEIGDINCRTCHEEKCNGSVCVRSSIVLLMASVTIYKLFN